MANIKELIQSIESTDSSFDEKLEAINKMEETLVALRQQEETAVQDNVDLIVEAIKVMENKVTAQLEIAKSIVPEKGDKGDKGERGLDGRQGIDGKNGQDGRDGKDGLDGKDGISVSNAQIDFDGSLVITLSTGQEINVGEVVAPELQERIKLVTSGGAGTVLPDQSSNSGKFLTTNGTTTSWSSVAGGLSYQGTWNASTNTPTLASGVGVNGYYYITATAGSTNLDGITDWQVGDWLMFNGTVWQKIDQSNLVTSVAGRTGAITLSNTDISGLGTMSTQSSSNVSITGGSITGITDLAVADGGTGSSTAQGAINTLAGAVTSGSYLRGNGTNVVMNTIQAADVPTLNQNTTGSAATLTTGRTIAITGDLAYTSTSFNGSANVTAAGTLATVNTNVGSFTNASLTVNGKGLITAASSGTAPVTSVTATSPVASTGGATPVISMPAATTTVSGYLTSTDWTTFNNKGSGTITSVTGTAPVVSSGGTTPAISMAAATTSVNGYLTSTDWTTFNNKGSGTVTSVAALTLGTTGTDLSSTVATGTTTPVITLNVPTASATNRGALSSADWTTFNNKGSGTVTAVSVVSANGFAGTSSGGATPALTLSTTITGVLKGNATAISAATSGTDYSAGTSALTTGILKSTTTTGALSIAVAADFPTLNQNTTGTAANITASSNSTLTTLSALSLPGSQVSGNISGNAANVTGTVAVANGGTGLTTTPANGALDIGNGTGFTRTTLTAGSNITITNASGSITIAATGSTGVSSVTGTSPVVSSGGANPAISLATAYGDTLNPYASKTANYILAAPNGTAGAPTFRAVVAADIPTLNQSTTGSAATLTTTRAIYGNNFDGSAALTQVIASTYGGTGNGFAKLSGPTTTEKTFTLPNASATILTDNAAVTVLQGGTGATTASGARTNLGLVIGTDVLAPTGSAASLTSFPTFNQNTTGTASNVTGTVAIANGGTGQTTASAGFNALSPVTSTGDLIIGNGVNSATRLAIGTNNYVLTSNGTTASWQASSGGGISWQTVQTTNFSASTGNGYPINTTSGAITVTLPASPSAGNTIYLLDYAGKFATNNLTINPNGNKFNGGANNAIVSTNRESLGLVYIDATQGWIPFDGFNTSTPSQQIAVDFLVIAGGGGAGSAQGGAGGAGGYRTSAGTSGGGGSAESQLTLNLGTAYTVTVGAGGAGGASGAKNIGVQGSNSVFSTITSTGGGYGATSTTNGGSGGSGGGAGNEGNHTGGSGTANQGYAGGDATNGASNYGGGGGGGAGGVGSAGTSTTGGNGGLGVASSITGTSVTRASGGAAGTYQGGTVGTASAGGGGSAGASGASANNPGTNGTVNTGGGAGGNSCSGAADITVAGATGGSGVVIMKLLSGITATFSGGVTQTSATSGSYKIYTITATSTTSETVTFS